ncbi:MAG TPA: TetR family transcriptional regulator C-terminal domain-containing protein [Thermoleophilaceae bacterium]|jgi:AcrR family transcriptional regulator
MAPPSHRERLIEGAIQCLRTKGYARTTARDIAAAAGANLASIGYHFGSKEQLLNEAVVRTSEDWARKMEAAAFAGEGAGPLERMATSWVAMLDSFERERPLLVAFVEAMAAAQWSDELRARMAASYRELRGSVGAMVTRGLGPEGDDAGADPRVVASYLMAVFDGFVLQWLLDPEDTPGGEELILSLGAALAAASPEAQAT